MVWTALRCFCNDEIGNAICRDGVKGDAAVARGDDSDERLLDRMPLPRGGGLLTNPPIYGIIKMVHYGKI